MAIDQLTNWPTLLWPVNFRTSSINWISYNFLFSHLDARDIGTLTAIAEVPLVSDGFKTLTKSHLPTSAPRSQGDTCQYHTITGSVSTHSSQLTALTVAVSQRPVSQRGPGPRQHRAIGGEPPSPHLYSRSANTSGVGTGAQSGAATGQVWALPGQNIESQNIESQNIESNISKDKISKSQNIECAKYRWGKISKLQNIELQNIESQNIENAKYRKARYRRRKISKGKISKAKYRCGKISKWQNIERQNIEVAKYRKTKYRSGKISNPKYRSGNISNAKYRSGKISKAKYRSGKISKVLPICLWVG